jgi:hypothetical protein
MTELNAAHTRRAIVEHTRRLAESAAAAGPDAAVPTTPGWTITDLVEHVGQTQHWVAEIIERRITDPIQLPTEMAVLPTDPRQHRPCHRLTGTKAPTATTKTTFGKTPVRDAVIGEATGGGTSSPADVQLDRANRRIRR